MYALWFKFYSPSSSIWLMFASLNILKIDIVCSCIGTDFLLLILNNMWLIITSTMFQLIVNVSAFLSLKWVARISFEIHIVKELLLQSIKKSLVLCLYLGVLQLHMRCDIVNMKRIIKVFTFIFCFDLCLMRSTSSWPSFSKNKQCAKTTWFVFSFCRFGIAKFHFYREF